MGPKIQLLGCTIQRSVLILYIIFHILYVHAHDDLGNHLNYYLVIDLLNWKLTFCPDKEAIPVYGDTGADADTEFTQAACAKDDTCYGVYDKDCDKRPPYNLCRSKYKLKSKSDCTYAKAGNIFSYKLTKSSNCSMKINKQIHHSKIIDFPCITIDLSCECKDFIDSNGQGNCIEDNVTVNESKICYVRLPSTCEDLKDSSCHPGEKYSIEAILNSGICAFINFLGILII